MKVFIGWSTDTSKQVAKALEEWLGRMPFVEPFVSDKIGKGRPWFPELMKELNNTQAFIACVTQDNVKDSIWMHFEAGVAARRPRDDWSGAFWGVFPFLVGVNSNDLLNSPFREFEATKADNKEDVRKLVSGLYAAGAKSVDDTLVDAAFNLSWNDLRKKLKGIKHTRPVQVSKPSTEGVLKDIHPSRRKSTRTSKKGSHLRALPQPAINPQCDAGASDGNPARPRRRRSLGVASQVTRSEEYLILDISETGAFLETRTPPIPDFTPMALNLNLDGRIAEVSASVVRVQKPDWGKAGGIGVHFEHFPGSSKDLIRHYVYADGVVDQG